MTSRAAERNQHLLARWRSGEGINYLTHRVNDLWLAALAIQHGMKAATQNGRDFAGGRRNRQRHRRHTGGHFGHDE